MKLLVFGDFHEGNHQPASRIDDFHETKIKLINEIDEIAKKHDCQAKLQLGDFLDKPNYPIKVLTEIIQRWKPMAPAQQLQRLQNGEITPEDFLALIKDDIPLIGVVGNHELIGNSLNTLKQTSIHLLSQMGFMRLVDREHPVILTDPQTGQTVAITGAPYHIHRDKPNYVGDYIIEEKLGDIHIHLVHGNGINKAIKPQHTTVDKFLYETKADVTIMGHYHKGFPIVEHEGKYAFNPGSPHLLTADEMGRKPQVAILDITPSGVNIELIPLKTGSDSSKVLTREHIEENEAKKKKIEAIKSTVAKAEISQRLTIKDVMIEIMENKNIKESVREDLIKRIEAKMEAMVIEHHETEPYTITKLILNNFQSHKHTVLELHEGLNILVGESGHGKSGIQRAFSFVMEGKKGGQSFIHSGEKECSVTLELSNGNTITRFLKENGKGGYKIFHADTQTIEEGNTKLLPTVQKMLGFFPLVIDEDLSIPLNFLKQGSSWYFIGDSMSSPNRAKVIGSFYQTHYADAVAKECEAESKKVATQLKGLNQEVELVEEQLTEYQYLDRFKEHLDLIEQKKAELQEKIERYKAMRTLYVEGMQLKAKEEHLTKVLQTIDEGLIQPKARLEKLKQEVSRYQCVSSCYYEYSIALKTEEKYQQLLIHLPDTTQWKEKYHAVVQKAQLLQVKQQQYRYTMNILQTQRQLKEKEAQIKSALQMLPPYQTLATQYNLIIEKFNRLAILRQLLHERQQIIQNGRAEKAKLLKIQQDLDHHLTQYRQLLTELKQCPICQSVISSETIEHIIAKHYQK